MKKKSFPIAVALLLLCACSKSGDQPGVQVRLALPVQVTKAALGEEVSGEFPVVWQAGDIVSLNGTLSNPLSAGLAGGADAAFSFVSFSGSSPYNLLYPGSLAGEIILDGKTLPLYARGTNLGEVFSLHHVCCGIRVPLTGDLSVASLTLSAPGDESIAGTFTPSFTTGALNAVTATSSVTISYETPVALSGSAQYFFIFFSPGTFSKGLHLKAQNSADVYRCWHFATGSTLVKGKLYLLPETSFSSRDWAEGCEVSLEIMNEDPISFEI